MSSTNFHLTFEKLEIIIWAILSPGLILYFSSDKLIKITPTSPLKSESIVPGEFKTVIPCFSASPDLGRICPSNFSGKDIFKPVGIRILWKGFKYNGFFWVIKFLQ